MRVGFTSFGWLVVTLLLSACSETKQSASPGGFEPVTRVHPTESGDWVVDPRDPSTLYALGQRSMRSRDGGRTWSELDWPPNARSLGFSRAAAGSLLLRVDYLDEETDGKLFESLDDGERWTDTGAVLSNVGELIVVDREDGVVLLTWREGALVRSTDKGRTWSEAALEPDAAAIFQKLGRVIVSSGASPVVYVEATVFTEQYEPMVFVSADGGETFVVKPVPGGEDPQLSLDCFGRLYVLDDTTVYRSSDTGDTWNSVAELAPEARSFGVLRGAPSACNETVLATGNQGSDFTLWRLDGTTLESRALREFGTVSSLGGDRLLSLDPFGPRRRSDDGGSSWWTAGVDLGSGDLVVSPAGDTLFVAKGRELYRSDDGGRSWEGAASDTPSWQGLYADPADLNRLYGQAIYEDDAPWSFVSTDGGTSFQAWPVPTASQPERPEVIASTAPGELTVVTGKGFYTTRDGGAHFETMLRLPATQTVGGATIGAGSPPAIYAYVHDDGAPSASRVVASLDGGETWGWSDAGTYITDLVVAPQDSRVVLARPGQSGGEGLVRTVDGGTTWERLAVPEDRHLTVHFDPQPPYTLYAAGQRLHRSVDYGDTWESITEIPAGRRELELDPKPGGARYVLGERGLLYKMTE